MSEQENKVASTFKSSDTEEWFDIVFNRPIGYQWAKLFARLGVHPNTVTVMSMILGAAAGFMFAFDADNPRGLAINIFGVILLVWANFYDSADGQLARMTNQRTQLGRILDGASSDAWFIPIYAGIAYRLSDKPIPFLPDHEWGIWAWVLSAVSGFIFHTYQCQLADYYRNIHLYFLKGKEGSEFDNYRQQKEKYEQMPFRGHAIEKIFQWFYVNYTHTQELATPQFQRFYRLLRQTYGDNLPDDVRQRFRKQSLPLMKWTNILTFNTRALALYIGCLADIPWLFPAFEIIVLTLVYIHMRCCHERFCRKWAEEMEGVHSS